MTHSKKSKKRHCHHHSHHRSFKATDPNNVNRFLVALLRKVKKHGFRFYKKRMSYAEKTVDRLLKEYHMLGHNAERYWKLKGMCVLIGKEPVYL